MGPFLPSCSPACVWVWHCSLPGVACGIFLWKLHAVVNRQCSHLSSLHKASHPSRESAAPPSLVSSADLIRIRSTPASRSLIKTLNRASPRPEPWGSLPVSGHQPGGHSTSSAHPQLGGVLEHQGVVLPF